VALFCGHDSIHLLYQIAGAKSTAELAPLLGLARRMTLDALANPNDVDDRALLAGAFTQTAFETAVWLSQQVMAAGIDPPLHAHCWFAFGPAARGELPRPALPNFAVVYDDALESDSAPWFAALAGEAAQPCTPLSVWRRFYSEAIRDP